MGLNIVIYQALLYVSIIFIVAVIFSYISHKTRKPGMKSGYFRIPKNHMRSIQRDLYIENIGPRENQNSNEPTNHSYGFERRHQSGFINQQKNVYNPEQLYQSKPEINFRSPYHTQVNRNPVYFR